jgi:hypothetical protein
MIDRHQPCPAEDLQVSRISETEWRVADARISDSSPSKVLGFVQRRGETFEVLSLDAPDRDLCFPGWAAAIGSFSDDPQSAKAPRFGPFRTS